MMILIIDQVMTMILDLMTIKIVLLQNHTYVKSVARDVRKNLSLLFIVTLTPKRHNLHANLYVKEKNAAKSLNSKQA